MRRIALRMPPHAAWASRELGFLSYELVQLEHTRVASTQAHGSHAGTNHRCNTAHVLSLHHATEHHPGTRPSGLPGARRGLPRPMSACRRRDNQPLAGNTLFSLTCQKVGTPSGHVLVKILSYSSVRLTGCPINTRSHGDGNHGQCASARGGGQFTPCVPASI